MSLNSRLAFHSQLIWGKKHQRRPNGICKDPQPKSFLRVFFTYLELPVLHSRLNAECTAFTESFFIYFIYLFLSLYSFNGCFNDVVLYLKCQSWVKMFIKYKPQDIFSLKKCVYLCTGMISNKQFTTYTTNSHHSSQRAIHIYIWKHTPINRFVVTHKQEKQIYFTFMHSFSVQRPVQNLWLHLQKIF